MGCPFKEMAVVMRGWVLDVSRFAGAHPGGCETLGRWAGRDIGDVFLAMHGPWSRAHRLVKELPVLGRAEGGERRTTEVQRDFRALAEELGRETVVGRWQMWAWWLLDFGLVMGLFAGGAWAMMRRRRVLGAVLVGLGFFQLGWISHDLAHKQVLSDHWLLRPVVELYGVALGGYSYDWWRKKHNRMHHPQTNVIGGDEDIDTMPFIAWDEKIAAESGGGCGWFVANQHWVTWVSLLFARLFWRWRSVEHVVRERLWREIAALLVHYVAYAAALVWVAGLSVVGAVAWALSAEMLAGFLTAFVFIQSHNGKEVKADVDTDFWTHQLLTTSNVRPGWFTNVFSGYLNLQIEHHLFPWMPRRMLLRARPRVKALCERHGLPYREYGWWESTARVYRHLKTVSDAVCAVARESQN